MVDSLATRPSLLLRLRDSQDSLAWIEFVGLYGPVIYAYGRRHGLQDADAADLSQDVLRAVSASMPRFEYDADRGGFRRWLFTLTRNELADFVRRARRSPAVGGSAERQIILQHPAEEKDAEVWEEEYQRQLLEWAAERVKDEVQASTWQAFWLTAVEGQKAEQAARDLGMSVGAVYIAKSRVIARLREQIEWKDGR